MTLGFPRHLVPARFTVGLLFVFVLGCKPSNQSMLVVNVQGDVFLPKLQACTWKIGQTERCEIASRGSILPDARGDLLLCGDKTRLAWSQTWLRSDIKTQIYNAAQIRTVKFHGIGQDGGRGRSPLWTCNWSAAGIDCE
jgi:hypothetical protein